MKIATLVIAVSVAPIWAQEIKLPPSIERLASKAEQSVDVTMDGSTLRLASRFLSDKNEDEAKTKKLLAGLQSISVRSFEFAREGEYDRADLDPLRAQLTAPAWSKIVGVRSKGEGDVDVFLKNGAGGTIGGVVIIAAEARELTIVSIVGTLDPSQLADLGGQYGIPRLDFGRGFGGFRRENR